MIEFLGGEIISLFPVSGAALIRFLKGVAYVLGTYILHLN